MYCARFLRRLAEPEEFEIGQDVDERVSDELLMSSNLKSKKVDLQKLLKLLSAEMPVMWKPMTQSIRCTWNNLLSKANVLADLKQESW